MPSLEEIKRKSIEPHAMRLGFDYTEDYGEGDLRPAQRALELLATGFDVHVRFMQADAFPSLERRIRKRGAKLVRRQLLWTSAICASFLTQLVPTLIIEIQETAGNSERGDGQKREDYLYLRSLIEDYFPLPKEVKELMQACTAEFEVLRTQMPREEVAEGLAPANAYSSALLRGESPEENPALVEEQRRFARDYFINQAALANVKVALDWEHKRISMYKRVAGRLLDISRADGDGVRKYRDRSRAVLLDALRPYQERAKIDPQSLRETLA